MPSGVASLVPSCWLMLRTDQASKRADGHAHFHKDTKRCATYSRVRAEANDPRGDGLKGVKVESSVLHPLEEHDLPVSVIKTQQHDAQQVKNGGGVDNLMMGICAYQKRCEDRDEEVCQDGALVAAKLVEQ
ncbi:hypothetical protein NEUTE1DRAFT_98972 [Neurospora tetrasperma FGSC 2508]|uniref:Uncharacterized protein n=1 Tax=Neurospora tetrasperma (strain FGSC 2508 / ATCC MYA-4615 / P0657) TaxID=510951 RepID=F8MHA8_NEUT8|nr:uncharacterized protein NEUTE1DRAFT_98972 [Neurospora tetrasperma FGSC 2508]EGO58773.1 hypothetical protein NEUTE1DRAFT_98972 [Neurospora tetrasperma FGSC 2508]EGZ72869.1 hypothetical protein NEUTE2DRAFT_127224 [Neurospora tetrasperma FGSC 2509]